MDDLVPIYFPEENVLFGKDLFPISRMDGGVLIGKIRYVMPDTRYKMNDMGAVGAIRWIAH
jgi:hypothetical protein